MKRLFSYFWVISFFLYAGEFEKLSLENGLPSEKIKHILEDNKGYLWIGTDKGLVRTDGDNFKLYQKNVFSNTSIRGNDINEIHLNENGNIATISDSRFLNIYDKTTNEFTATDFGQELLLKKDLIVYDSSDTKDGNVWIGTNAGLFLYDVHAKKIEVINRLVNYQIYQVALLGEGLLLNTSKGILKYDIKNKSFDTPEFYNELKFKEVLNLTVEENYIKIITKDGIFVFDMYNKHLSQLYKAEKPIKIAYSKGYNRYYFIIENEIFAGIIKRDDLFISKIANLPNDLAKINNIFVSSNNFLWLGTDNGLYFYRLNGVNFENYNFENGSINYFYKDGDTEYIAYKTQGLIEKTEKKSRKIIDKVVNYITKSGDRIYFTTTENEIYYYEKQNKKLSRIELSDAFKQFDINCIYIKGHTLFVGTKAGLYSIDLNTGDKEEYYFDFLRQKKNSQSIKKLEVDIENKNKLWIAIKNGGLVKLDLQTRKIDEYNYVNYDGDKLIYTDISDFLQDGDRIYIATEDAGLLLLDKSDKTITKISLDIEGTIQSIFEDKIGNIWLTTENKLALIDSKFENIKYYGKNDGIKAGLIKMSFVDQSYVYLIGENAYTIFRPQDFKNLEDDSKLSFETISFQNTQLVKDIRYSEYIFVPYSEKNFKISFKKLNYFGGQKGEYFYKLEGLDKDWNRIGSKEEINFRNIKKGKYVLRIKYYKDDRKNTAVEDSIKLYIEGNPLVSFGAFLVYFSIIWLLYEFIKKYNIKGYKLAFQVELNKFATILNSSNNSKDLITEFMKRSLNFLGIENLELAVKEYNQKYITTHKFEEINQFVSENIFKDKTTISLKEKNNGVTFELETDIVNDIFLSRKIEENKVYYYFDVRKKISGIFCFSDTDDRLKSDKYFNKTETMIRQFLLSYKKLLTFEEMAKLANYDSLTNIYNRRYFDQLVKFNIEQARRYKHKLSFAILDIDDFKGINDTYGHNIGDFIIQEFVEKIRKNIRDTDIFARFGGEEFVICFTETEKGSAYTVCERIREEIENESFIINDTKIHATITIGISEFEEEDTLDTLMVRADKALYEGKKSGKNKIIFKK